MIFHIRGNKIEVTDAIQNYIEEKIGKINKYFPNSEQIEVNVLIKEQGINKKIEVTIPIKKLILRSEQLDKNLYAAIDLVSDKLERQIRKNKTRMTRKNYKEVIFEGVEETEFKDEEIVKRKKIDLKPMNEEEAILQMNLLGHEFFVFYNSNTDSNCVLYRRKDDNYGIIEMN